uniref:Uncharacterized protein n=1 Tax=Micrurus corallinus TaxID=54390 RepID=A0A2D4EMG1_MICCO
MLDVTLLDEAEAVAIGELDGVMLVSEKAVEDTALSGVGVVVFKIVEVPLLSVDAVEGTELIGERAPSDVIDSGVVASGEVVKYSVVIECGVVVSEEVVVFIELEVIVVPGADVVVCDVVDAVKVVAIPMLSGIVLVVSIGGELTILLFDEAKAVVLGKLDGVMLVSEKLVEDTGLSGELGASDVTDSGVVASGEVVKYFVVIEC